jgi:hypothetical protein
LCTYVFLVSVFRFEEENTLKDKNKYKGRKHASS